MTEIDRRTLSTKVVNLRVQQYDIFIGRPSKWGNPFTHLHGIKNTEKVDSIEEAVSRYEAWIQWMMEAFPEEYNLDELRGKVLGCYCKPGLCHGDVLVRLADEY